MKKLDTVDNILDRIVIDMTVRNMLNPKNEDWYLPNLTLQRVIEIYHDIAMDECAIMIFWAAFDIARTQIKPKLLSEEQLDYSCPECGCRTYLTGCCCPNCDHYEDY